MFFTKCRAWVKWQYLKRKCLKIGAFPGNNIYYALGFSSNRYEKLSIGKRCTFGGDVYFAAYEQIIIGDDCMFAHGAKILTGTHDYTQVPMSSSFIAKTVIVGNNCWIGANAMLLPGVSLGDNVVVGAGAVVTKDIVSNSIVAGVPARVIDHI